MALPQEPYAQVAEAWGGKLGLDLLTACQADTRIARVIGDNLGVIRYGAERAALRNPAIHRPLATALAEAAEKGWTVHWRAVRRRLNKAADAGATEAVLWAHRLRKQGATQPEVHVEWF